MEPAGVSSPEEACQALFAAVQSDNERPVEKVLGGGKELISSGDYVEDEHDRELFLEKYRQMHRVVLEPDGTAVLYIGAENWPFPVPLVSKNGKWYFDSDSGTDEIVFRRVGENEAKAIEICHSVAAIAGEAARGNAGAPDAATEDARRLIGTDAAGTGSGATKEGQSPTPLHGYYFRKLHGHKARDGGPIVVAYPAQYRSSGVMTFILSGNGDVYEKDLGPQTLRALNAITKGKPDRTWALVN